jgi:hypothetical protein
MIFRLTPQEVMDIFQAGRDHGGHQWFGEYRRSRKEALVCLMYVYAMSKMHEEGEPVYNCDDVYKIVESWFEGVPE